MSNSERVIGRVKAIFRYPVKSMGGEGIEEASLWWHGIEGDRKVAFVRGDHQSGFPWLTGREIPEMIRYRPTLVTPDAPRDSAIVVQTPGGETLPVDSQALRDELAARYGREIFLLRMSRGTFDSMSLSMIGQPTLAALGEMAGMPLEVERFRPNLLIEPADGEAFSEEGWLGSTIIFGEREDSARVRVERQNVRCMMINLDPESARQSPQVLRTVVREREKLAGIYCSTQQPGTIRVGDLIRVDS